MRFRVRSLMVVVLAAAIILYLWREARQNPSWVALVLEGCRNAMLLGVGLALMTLRPSREEGGDDRDP